MADDGVERPSRLDELEQAVALPLEQPLLERRNTAASSRLPLSRADWISTLRSVSEMPAVSVASSAASKSEKSLERRRRRSRPG